MDCLLLVDLQNDFMPGGALAVPHGDEVVPVANDLAARFDFVVASQDWHPAGHLSFASQHAGRKPGDEIELGGITQQLWPDHCVQGTAGAELSPGLDQSRISEVVRKGTDPEIDSYSAFNDALKRRSTGLEDLLRERGVETVYVLGLATEYCVKFSALDSLGAGFRTVVVSDGCRGIGLKPSDIQGAWDELGSAGASIALAEEVP